MPVKLHAADPIDAAHARGVVHRDLKPANVKLRPDGTVKVLDFGIAKVLDPYEGAVAGATALPGTLMGTPAYMSPEQANGVIVDRRTDVWAFGCVLYEMLTAQRAFDGEGTSATLARVLEREPDFAIQRCVSQARKTLDNAGDHFKTDYLFQDAAVLNGIRACETSIDLANMLIRQKRLGIPPESRESFSILARENAHRSRAW